MSDSNAPIIERIVRHDGIAGFYALSATVRYMGEDPEVVTFQGSVYGSPITMQTPHNPGGVFVDRAVMERLGQTLNEAWVRAFFANADTKEEVR